MVNKQHECQTRKDGWLKETGVIFWFLVQVWVNARCELKKRLLVYLRL
uniref:Uncharacterized protein n=1 Tax=Anguilla anguilla TaxID=7936 RepID=A0A0E9SRW7_ANGAN